VRSNADRVRQDHAVDVDLFEGCWTRWERANDQVNGTAATPVRTMPIAEFSSLSTRRTTSGTDRLVLQGSVSLSAGDRPAEHVATAHHRLWFVP
jgi:hypothetical protein